MLPRVANSTLPFVGAVHLYQTDDLFVPGSPSSIVAPVLRPTTTPETSLMT